MTAEINKISSNYIAEIAQKRRREEANSVNHNETGSINSSASSNISSEGVLCDIWTRFTRIVHSIMIEKNLTLDEVCNRVAIEISDYGIGKICAQTEKNFYRNIR
ncbi:hypothetical protein GLOIN_2v1486303 [Rhizophagus clarus]|uniref:Uncharacterized protein n=1 Tax=Rhizophagus clarus TaxID=94130 RepID=A0A8H3LYA6_9GLOM|nr:hypothetical protein GLOIN_2v1486303 [Rhizophagus clarus]